MVRKIEALENVITSLRSENFQDQLVCSRCAMYIHVYPCISMLCLLYCGQFNMWSTLCKAANYVNLQGILFTYFVIVCLYIFTWILTFVSANSISRLLEYRVFDCKWECFLRFVGSSFHHHTCYLYLNACYLSSH